MISALIPARSGSKRVKNKNIRELAGLPLFAYSIKTAQNCPSISEVFVTTDSLDYMELATQHYCDVIKRPPELARDDSLDVDYVTHALPYLNSSNRFIAILRPTTPIRTVTLIETAIREFFNLATEPNAPTSLRSVHEMSESAYKCFMMPHGKLLTPIGTIPNAPNQFQIRTYQANGYIDIVRRDYIEQEQDLYGPRIYGFETPPAVEIDTEHDLKIAAYEMALREGGEDVFFTYP